MSKDVQFAKLDDDFAYIKDGTTLIQRMILSICSYFPDGMQYDNPAPGKIFQVTPDRICHLVGDLRKKGFTIELCHQSKVRKIYLNPDHPTLAKIADYHETLKELHRSKQRSEDGSLRSKQLSKKCLHCYFHRSTTFKVTMSIKEIRNKDNRGAEATEGESNNSLKAKPSTLGSKQSVTNYSPSAAFEDFWSRVKFSKGDRFRSWEMWQRLRIEELGLPERVKASLAKALPEWQQREPKYRTRVAHWLAEGPWESDNDEAVQAPAIRKFDGPGPTKEFYQERLDRLLLIPEDKRTAKDREDIQRLQEACQ
ncbi:MAG: hypothetical protein ISS70_03105 [Phycisphaerae bacterium]|nr:hypothetical protein [Phycisphaerae bacterium]